MPLPQTDTLPVGNSLRPPKTETPGSIAGPSPLPNYTTHHPPTPRNPILLNAPPLLLRSVFFRIPQRP